jgi:ribA/ribD-fused uncharacterized protein
MSRNEFITDDFVFFWNGIYSQWYSSNFIINDITFNCCEQYMMYMKAKTFNDDEIAQEILKETSPMIHKSLGKKVKNFDRDLWDQKCFSIVYQANFAKFSQNENLKKQLLETGNRILVEASPYDKIWGIKMGVGDDYIESPSHWEGLNLLGFVLTTVRKNLR